MGYTKKAMATRQRIIDTASQLFFTKGFARTKLDEILLIAKVRKGNFYYYFRSKDDLALAVIRETGRPLVLDWVRSLVDPEADPRDNLSKLAEHLMDTEMVRGGQGNPLSNLALEMSTLSEDFRRELDMVMSEVVGIFAEQIERGIARGGLEISGQARHSAAFLVSVIEGSMLLFRLNRNEQLLRDHVDFALNSILRSNPLAKAS
ncbi:MAG: TetR/AcrR family transcriptional regulator [bacterium]|nr:TetR/AcrR family transcriptional regulator [bacterium]